MLGEDRSQDASHMRIHIIVVNWNQPENTVACLRSIATIEGIDPRVILVDNGSSDDSVARVSKEFPEVEIIRSPTNLGYGPGANLGIKQALAEDTNAIFFLNNDTIIDRHILISLLPHMADDVGLLAPLIYYETPNNKIWSLGGNTNPLTLEKSNPGKNTIDHGNWQSVIERDFVPGTAILVPRKTIDTVGIFDENFWMYYDDADYCERVRRTGLRILVIPEAKVWHKIAASSGGRDSPNERYWMARSSILFFKKHSRPWQWIFIIPYRLGSAFRTSLRLLRRQSFPAFSAYWRGLIDGFQKIE